MNIILSEAKDHTVGMRDYRNQLKTHEAKMIQGNLEMLAADGRSLTSLGMTEHETKDLTVAMRDYRNQAKIDEAKMIQGSLKIWLAYERSLASLRMTQHAAKDLTSQ